jgi:hypothetical protein
MFKFLKNFFKKSMKNVFEIFYYFSKISLRNMLDFVLNSKTFMKNMHRRMKILEGVPHRTKKV